MFQRLTLFMGLLALCSCAPEQARQLREGKPWTVGLLGVAHRPTPDATMGASVGYTVQDFGENDRHITKLNGFYVQHPSADSAFMFGGGLSYEIMQDSNYQTDRIDFRLPIGWFWIWENGISLMMDFGPGVTVFRSNDNLGTNQRLRFFTGAGILGYSF